MDALAAFGVPPARPPDVEPREASVPAWLAEMEFCHIDDGSLQRTYCGLSGEGVTCGEYYGEAICPACGDPTCPRCAQLSALEDALEGE